MNVKSKAYERLMIIVAGNPDMTVSEASKIVRILENTVILNAVAVKAGV